MLATGRHHAGDLRKGRFSESGRLYLVTTVTHGRRRLFVDLWRARRVIRVMRDFDERKRTRTWAFVLMPDHLHWLFELGNGHSLSQVAGAMKSISARRLGVGKVWQPGFHDHAVRREEDVQDIARYIVANPVRAGLVRRVGDYSYWDAIWL